MVSIGDITFLLLTVLIGKFVYILFFQSYLEYQKNIEQSSLSILAQKYLHKCDDTYLILQNKFLHIYEYSFGVKILRDDCVPRVLNTFF